MQYLAGCFATVMVETATVTTGTGQRAEAVARAEQMRLKKIAGFEKQIAKLKKAGLSRSESKTWR